MCLEIRTLTQTGCHCEEKSGKFESQLALLNTKVCIFRDKIEKKILNVFKLCTR